MSSPETTSARGIYLRLMAVLLLLLLCAGSGAFLGWWSAPKPSPKDSTAGAKAGEVPAAAPAKVYPPYPPNRPPLFFYAGTSADSEAGVTAAEIAMAAAAGIHQIILPVTLPWTNEGLPEVVKAIQRTLAANPDCALLLEVDCDPPAAWLANHPDEQCVIDKAKQPSASVASTLWREEAGQRLEALVQMLHLAPERRALLGLVIAGGGKNQWLMEGVDRAPAMTAAYRAWLTARYAADTALAAAWGEKKASLKEAKIPASAKPDPTASAMLQLPADQPYVDYARCASDATVGAIGWLAARARAVGWQGMRLYAPYGFGMEFAGGATGHNALGRLLESPLDGFISPFSYLDRGLGGSGGFMGPVHSALYRGKQWICVDDTRTGVARDAITGSITRLEGLREQDVHNVQARNFALALVNGLGMVWSDPMGEGTLHDEGVWQRIGQMRAIYEQTYPQYSVPAEGGNPAPPPPAAFQPGLVVVIDEAAAALCRTESDLGGRLLHAVRDAALRSGTAVQFCLLTDFLEDRNPPAPVYLFANALAVDEAQRTTLHARLAKEQAYAIWLYAPGYYSASTGTEGISKTVGMQVKAFKDPMDAGSAFLLTGRWVEEGKPLEAPTRWNPLFYVDDPESDALARYVAAEKVSVAMRSMPEGWASIYIGEPNLTPALLRELMSIIEQPIYVRPAAQRQFDAIFSNRSVLAIHGTQVGERTIDLGAFSNTVDLFDPDIGWPQKDSFVLALKTGETRLLKVSPMDDLAPVVEDEPLPEDMIPDVPPSEAVPVAAPVEPAPAPPEPAPAG